MTTAMALLLQLIKCHTQQGDRMDSFRNLYLTIEGSTAPKDACLSQGQDFDKATIRLPLLKKPGPGPKALATPTLPTL